MLCQKKKVNPAVLTGGNEKKKLKKKGPITSTCDGWTRVSSTFSPAI